MSRGASESLLRAAVRGTAAARTPKDAAREILQAAADHVQAAAGCVYLLDLRTGRYSAFADWPVATQERLAEPRAGFIDIPPERITTLDHFVRAADGDAGASPAGPGVVVYSFRWNTCLGAIRLDGPDLAEIDPGVADDLLGSADLLVSVYEDAFAFNLLEALQEPLDYGRADVDFFEDLGVLISLSSGMDVVVLREHEDDALRCLALRGFGDAPAIEEWDLQPIDAYPPFALALTGETVAVNEMSGEELASLRARHWFTDVRSFVAMPVHVGTEIFGVLSLGARCAYEYAPLELRGFESLANGVGVSIANFRNSRALGGRVGEFTEAGVAITAVEVARAARHEAVGFIDNCNAGLNQLWRKLGKQHVSLQEDFEAISKDLSQLNLALNKIKFATKPPDRVWTSVGLRRIWDEACTAVVGRLDEERVNVRYTGPDVIVWATPDWLRQVFLNLLLNSVDAFKDAKKGGRRVDLAVERPSARATQFEIVYRDNATGINAQRLQGPPEFADIPAHQRVFEPGVTSKHGGSGFGLWLVRRILDQHKGSIDLVDHRNGVTFVVRLPKPGEGSP